jgi:hypothetical protein
LAERARLIKPEPWILQSLRRRRKMFLEDVRNAALDFLIDVARGLRNRDTWVETTAAATQQATVSYLVTWILGRLLPAR